MSEASGERPGNRARRRLVALRIAGAAVALGLVAAGAAQSLATRDELAARRGDLAATEAELGRTELALAGTRADLAATDASVARTDDDLVWTNDEGAALDVELGETTAARDGLFAELGTANVELEGLRVSLADGSRSSAAVAERLSLLARCLDGARRATAARRADDPAGTVAALQSVSAACLQANALAGGGIEPPAFPFDFADPFVLSADGRYLAYSTNGGGGNIQLITSTDLRTWTWVGDALPQLPGWADPHRTWAPSLVERGGTYLLYYTARERATGHQCVTVATAGSPLGPFVDRSSGPFLCQHDLGGSIDASPFLDAGGGLHLTWKSEDETVGGSARLWSAPLDPTGTGLGGPAVPLLRADRAWEAGTIEGPSMVVDGGRTYLFYSGNRWGARDYGVGYAVCDSPAGPCRKPGDAPLLASAGAVAGPGGQEVFRDLLGGLWLSYHAYTEPDVGYPNHRRLRLDRLSFVDGTPVLLPG